MAAKLTWEYTEGGEDIIIRKKKGRLTVEEIFQFLHEPNMLNIFDGDLAVILFRVNSERGSCTGWEEEAEGDQQMVFMIGDSSLCPICQKHELFPQYCPQCGEKLKMPLEGRR